MKGHWSREGVSELRLLGELTAFIVHCYAVRWDKEETMVEKRQETNYHNNRFPLVIS